MSEVKVGSYPAVKLMYRYFYCFILQVLLEAEFTVVLGGYEGWYTVTLTPKVRN
jgi:hypothetical protein